MSSLLREKGDKPERSRPGTEKRRTEGRGRAPQEKRGDGADTKKGRGRGAGPTDASHRGKRGKEGREKK